MTPEQRHPDPNQAEGNGNSSKDSSVPNSGGPLSWLSRLLLGKGTQEQINEEVKKQVEKRVEKIFSSSKIEKIEEDFKNKEIKNARERLDKECEKLFQQYKDLDSRVSRASGGVYLILISAAILGGFAFMQGGPIVSIMSIDVLKADIADLKQDVRLLMDNQE